MGPRVSPGYDSGTGSSPDSSPEGLRGGTRAGSLQEWGDLQKFHSNTPSEGSFDQRVHMFGKAASDAGSGHSSSHYTSKTGSTTMSASQRRGRRDSMGNMLGKPRTYDFAREDSGFVMSYVNRVLNLLSKAWALAQTPELLIVLNTIASVGILYLVPYQAALFGDGSN